MSLNADARSPGQLPDDSGLEATEGTTRGSALRVREFSARDISQRLSRCDAVLEALSRQYRILDTLREATSQLVVHRPLPDLFELLLDLLLAAVPAQRGAILLRENSAGRLELKASRSRSGLPFVSVSRA